MDKEQTVSEMANEVLARQVEARAERTGEPLEEALWRPSSRPRPGANCETYATVRTAPRGRTSGRKASRGNGLRSDPTRLVDVHPLEARHPTFFRRKEGVQTHRGELEKSLERHHPSRTLPRHGVGRVA